MIGFARIIIQEFNFGNIYRITLHLEIKTMVSTSLNRSSSQQIFTWLTMSQFFPVIFMVQQRIYMIFQTKPIWLCLKILGTPNLFFWGGTPHFQTKPKIILYHIILISYYWWVIFHGFMMRMGTLRGYSVS
jgi:hypothetical protein